MLGNADIFIPTPIVRGPKVLGQPTEQHFQAMGALFPHYSITTYAGKKKCNRFNVLLTETLKIWSKEVPIQVKEVISLDNENKPVSKIAKNLGLANSTV